MKKYLCLFLILSSPILCAWNATGHKVVAEIALDNLTPKAKALCRIYLNAPNNKTLENRFLSASVWLDVLRKRGDNSLQPLHYIDIPFSKDGTKLPPIQTPNASLALKDAVAALSSPTTPLAEKNRQLKILIHVVGDIHQPLHTVTLVSQANPDGDMGGNLFKLGTNKVGNNLHKYWDNASGYLPYNAGIGTIKKMAHSLEKRRSCLLANQEPKMDAWIKASNYLAKTEVYAINEGEKPSTHYQISGKRLAQQQLLFAGCRLAKLLNELA